MKITKPCERCGTYLEYDINSSVKIMSCCNCNHEFSTEIPIEKMSISIDVGWFREKYICNSCGSKLKNKNITFCNSCNKIIVTKDWYISERDRLYSEKIKQEAEKLKKQKEQELKESEQREKKRLEERQKKIEYYRIPDLIACANVVGLITPDEVLDKEYYKLTPKNLENIVMLKEQKRISQEQLKEQKQMSQEQLVTQAELLNAQANKIHQDACWRINNTKYTSSSFGVSFPL